VLQTIKTPAWLCQTIVCVHHLWHSG
jgi:hypothetical protein